MDRFKSAQREAVKMFVIGILFIATLSFVEVNGAKETKLYSDRIAQAFKKLSSEEVKQVQAKLKGRMSLAGDVRKGQNMSVACSRKIAKLFSTDLAQLFPMVDAIGKPGSGVFQGNFVWLGSFSECADMKHFKYCLAGFNLKTYIFFKKSIDQYGILGTCMPQECNPTDIRLLLNEIPLSFKYPPYVTVNISFPEHTSLSYYGNSVLCEERDTSYSSGTKATLTICGIILALCLMGTVLDLFISWIESPLNCIKEQNMFSFHSLSTHPYTEDVSQEVPAANSFGSQTSITSDKEHPVPTPSKGVSVKDNSIVSLLLCFSLVKNAKAVLCTDVPDRAILSINGIRMISMTWVILGHVYAIGEVTGGLENFTDLAKILGRFTFLAIDNAFFSVDSFFLLSGLLVSYLGMRRLESKGKLPIWQFYLHRYIRLTPTYGFVILFYMYIFPLMGAGPFWSTITAKSVADPCRDYWWTNIIYINNFYPTKLGKECLGWGWYLANDMQFFIISPIILYAMYKLKLFGAILSNGILVAVSFIVTGILFGHYKLNALEVAADVVSRPNTGPSFEDVIYTKPYCRIQPYLVGMVLGYFLFKKYRFSGKLKWLFYLVGWAVAITLGMTVVYGTWESSKKGGKPFTLAENILYGSLSRFIWAVAVSWVIFACHNGFGGLVQSFLSWKAFIPLSRLTYGAYLIHPMTIIVFYQSKLSGRAYTDMDLAFQFVSVTVMSYAAAFILAICVEFPILSLDKILFSQK